MHGSALERRAILAREVATLCDANPIDRRVAATDHGLGLGREAPDRTGAAENLRRFFGLLKARQKVGKYGIDKRIADGPMAAVYAAVGTIRGGKGELKVAHASR